MISKKYVNLSPSPISLIESLRNLGYTFEAAVADIIDNSITAHATEIDIRYAWNMGKPWVAIIDNGRGMDNDKLVDAMRFGSINPLDKRSKDDLGRFGLGMKTASFSFCRNLVVISKHNGKTACCEWDIDEIQESGKDEWKLGIIDYNSISKDDVLRTLFQKYIENMQNGTIVFWKKLDRIENGISKSQEEKVFNSFIAETRYHLEIVFHRYLSPDTVTKKINIRMNGGPIEALDPFNVHNNATQELPSQSFCYPRFETPQNTAVTNSPV